VKYYENINFIDSHIQNYSLGKSREKDKKVIEGSIFLSVFILYDLIINEIKKNKIY